MNQVGPRPASAELGNQTVEQQIKVEASVVAPVNYDERKPDSVKASIEPGTVPAEPAPILPAQVEVPLKETVTESVLTPKQIDQAGRLIDIDTTDMANWADKISELQTPDLPA